MELRSGKVILCLGCAALLLGSFLFEWSRPFWNMLDLFFFQHFNQSLEGRPLWQLFWALSNHKLADWVEDLVFLGFFLLLVLKTPKKERMRRSAELIFSVLCMAMIIIFVNRILVRDLLQLYRDSPTLAFPMSIRLSDEISWLSIKDYSNKSFPADHATTALLFATTYAFFSRGALRWSAIGYGIFLCLPRLFAGAHWFSDIAAGSGSILLCFFGLVFHTPLQAKCSRGIEALLGRLFFLKKREAEEA